MYNSCIEQKAGKIKFVNINILETGSP
jgi:hypothetical protein